MAIRTQVLRAAATAALLLGACALPGTSEAGGAHDGRLDWWREARFGLFLHWGLYAVPAGVWGDDDRHGEWIMNTAQIPVETYEGFAERFDPVKFDADEWARMAAAAGMRYVVITTKHHDGFALFDSQVSDYDVTATPFRRDVMAELGAACRRHGLKMCWYHSIMDWHHPDYLPRRGWETRSADGADFRRYVAYLRAQVTELLSNYGEIGVMWFDGEWEPTWSHADGQALYDLCRTLQPGVIVNNRVDVGRAGMEGMTEGADRAGDFGTPEQTIPARGLPGVDWETCMTMNGNWGFNAADRGWKSSEELVRNLIDIASKGGNFLLNVGPRADGTFPPEAVERLATIGRWMDVNGDAIHGTTASPIDAPEWGRVTAKAERGGDTTLFLHVFEWPADGVLELSGIGNDVRAAHLLGDPRRAVALAGGAGRLAFQVGPQAPASLTPDVQASVLAVRLAGAPIVYRAPEILADGDDFLDELEVTFAPPSDGLALEFGLEAPREGPLAGAFRFPAIDWRPWDGRPLVLRESTIVHARSLHRGEQVGASVLRRFTRVEPLAARAVERPLPGLLVRTYRGADAGAWDALPDFTQLAAEREETAATVALPPGYRDEHVARVYGGYVDVPATGMWTFALESDDGSRLYVDGRLVVDNDGLHGPATERGTLGLAAGRHALRAEWFNKTGGASLGLRVGLRGAELAPLGPARLSH
jgi:alpha-L-fucosidase